MDIITIEGYEFIRIKVGDAVIVFSTAKNGLNFNINLQSGISNLQKLKQWFGFKEIGYLKQIHSDYVFVCDGIVHEGDALITNKLNTAVGVFTADCVPIILYDMKNKVIGAVHSGWKSTQLKIVKAAIEKMKNQYGSRPEDLAAYIGPHNRDCCYEVGEEVADLFVKDNLYKGKEIYHNRKLDLESCIRSQLQSIGVNEENIHALNICTFCNENLELHSYRKDKESSGRMISFIYLNK
jgi:YfiH family protein